MAWPDLPKLTPEGQAWAVKAANDPVPSMIAIVALEGEDWPEAHRITAITQANRLGEIKANDNDPLN